MRNRSSCLAVFWSAGLNGLLASLLFLPGASCGQETPQNFDDAPVAAAASSGAGRQRIEPCAVTPFVTGSVGRDWKSLVASYAAAKEGSTNARNGFFFRYDRMIVSTSPALTPVASSFRAPDGASEVHLPQSGLAWESSPPNTTESVVSKIGSGNRIEFGRMETDNTGWMVSAFEQVSSSHETQSPR